MRKFRPKGFLAPLCYITEYRQEAQASPIQAAVISASWYFLSVIPKEKTDIAQNKVYGKQRVFVIPCTSVLHR